MRIALVGDIHGNYKAMEAFLEQIPKQGVDAVVCLGDYVTDGPYPERTLSLLHMLEKEYPCQMIRGNREQYLLENFYQPQGWKKSSMNGALLYISERISEEELRFFEGLPEAAPICFTDCAPAMLCHGTPDALRGNVRETEGLLEKTLRKLQQEYLFGGHTHEQRLASIRGKTYVNPGSLGLAEDGRGGNAQYAIAESDSRGQKYRTEFYTIPYDMEGYLRDFKESGIEEYGMVLTKAVKKSLVTGHNFFYDSVTEAYRRAGAAAAFIPEEIWEQVAQHFAL